MDRLIAISLIAVVVFSALAFGTTEEWSVMVLKMSAVLLLLLWAIKAVADRQLVVMIPASAWPILALLVLGLIQSVALTDGAGQRQSLSMEVEATRLSVTLLFCLVILFLVAANFFTGRERLQKLAYFLVIYGAAMALFALIQHFTSNGKIYWISSVEASSSPSGPFLNRNHFAGYMNMLIPVAVGLIVTGAYPGLRLLLGFAAALMGVASVLSLSRGGMTSLFAALMFLVAMSGKLWPHRQAQIGVRLVRIGAVVAILVAIIGGVIWVGAEPVITRITNTITAPEGQQPDTLYRSRGWLWQGTWAVFVAHPIAGVGYGAYQTAYHLYDPGNGLYMVDFAHNDYLQVLADCGIIGGALAVWFMVSLFRLINRGLQVRDRLLAGLALGGGGGIFAILVHSLFDFNLQVPSNALLFLCETAIVSQIGCLFPRCRYENCQSKV